MDTITGYGFMNVFMPAERETRGISVGHCIDYQRRHVEDMMTGYVRGDFIQSRNEEFDLKIRWESDRTVKI